MAKDQLSILAGFLRQNTDSLSYRNLDSFRETSEFIVKSSPNIAIDLMSFSDGLELQRRFFNLMGWIDGLDKSILENSTALGVLFIPYQVGIPHDEIKHYVASLEKVITVFSLEPRAPIGLTVEYIEAGKMNSEILNKYRNDPRFKKKFDDAAWGWS